MFGEKNALQVRMIMIIIAMRSGDGLTPRSNGSPWMHDIAHIASSIT